MYCDYVKCHTYIYIYVYIHHNIHVWLSMYQYTSMWVCRCDVIDWACPSNWEEWNSGLIDVVMVVYVYACTYAMWVQKVPVPHVCKEIHHLQAINLSRQTHMKSSYHPHFNQGLFWYGRYGHINSRGVLSRQSFLNSKRVASWVKFPPSTNLFKYPYMKVLTISYHCKRWRSTRKARINKTVLGGTLCTHYLHFRYLKTLVKSCALHLTFGTAQGQPEILNEHLALLLGKERVFCWRRGKQPKKDNGRWPGFRITNVAWVWNHKMWSFLCLVVIFGVGLWHERY